MSSRYKSGFVFVATLLLLCVATLTSAAPTFPVLTGRVVDNANLLSPSIEKALTAELMKHEQETSNQLVVVTLSSLDGYEIADYGYQLGRHWGIGQKDKNNGVLFIIAPKERRLRIEVGYGLEGVLTDALSKQIIDYEVLPFLRKGDYPGGIKAGTNAILKTLEGSYTAPAQQRYEQEMAGYYQYIVLFVVLFIVFSLAGIFMRTGKLIAVSFFGSLVAAMFVVESVVGAVMLAACVVFFVLFTKITGSSGFGGPGGYSSGSGRYGGRSSGGSSGGFSGGGGSFGGGGASGGW